MKNILIIGASSGIGLATANLLSKEGYNVIGTYNNTIVKPNNNTGISYHHYDVLASDKDFSFIPEVLDGIIYCPGSINLKPFNRIKIDDFKNDFELQVIGAIELIQNAIKSIQNSKNASIVFFSTVAVQSGFPFHTQVSVSKGAIEGFTKALSAELAPRVRVNCIAPSLTDTPLANKLINNESKLEANANKHPLKRIGTVEDIANAAAFLISDKSSWITGQIIHVDGGISTIKL
jgi:NAD(P)-dependent dehydrogenase (short-subunit alcohol dehydrogenase family)